MLKVKVYVIALYLESKNSDAEAIMQAGGNKRIAMHFLHKVTAEELRGDWSDGFKDNTRDVGLIKDEIDQFNASMRDVKVGDVIVVDDYLDVLINGTKIDSVKGAAFQRALLAIWLGSKPPNDARKEGILGGTGD